MEDILTEEYIEKIFNYIIELETFRRSYCDEDYIYTYEELQNKVIEYITKVLRAINYIKKFESYIPEDNKDELLNILRGDINGQE